VLQTIFKFYLVLVSDFKKDCNRDCKIDSRILNKMAVQILDTAKPSINLSANSIIKPLITNKNNPKVKMVIGKVSITSIGLINRFKIDNTMATITAVR
jgi:hypothetical protein